MRKTINPQPSLREPWLELEHARELETISSLLDAHPKLNELVLQDLRSVTPSAGSDVGRGGMSAEQVLRALLVKQLNQSASPPRMVIPLPSPQRNLSAVSSCTYCRKVSSRFAISA